MGNYTDVNGAPSTDADIDGWASAPVLEPGYTGTHLGPSVPARPVSVGAQACLCTLRLDNARRADLDRGRTSTTPHPRNGRAT